MIVLMLPVTLLLAHLLIALADESLNNLNAMIQSHDNLLSPTVLKHLIQAKADLYAKEGMPQCLTPPSPNHRPPRGVNCALGTYWMDRSKSSNTIFEQVVQHLAQKAGLKDENWKGAEWWIQNRPSSDPKGFHYDNDNTIFQQVLQTPNFNPLDLRKGQPLRASILYLSNSGGPTMVVNRQSIHATTPLPNTTATILSYPLMGRYMSFDGALLHGVLPDVRPLPEQEATGGTLRSTMLINFWAHSIKGGVGNSNNNNRAISKAGMVTEYHGSVFDGNDEFAPLQPVLLSQSTSSHRVPFQIVPRASLHVSLLELSSVAERARRNLRNNNWGWGGNRRNLTRQSTNKIRGGKLSIKLHTSIQLAPTGGTCSFAKLAPLDFTWFFPNSVMTGAWKKGLEVFWNDNTNNHNVELLLVKYQRASLRAAATMGVKNKESEGTALEKLYRTIDNVKTMDLMREIYEVQRGENEL
jgi:hypothetical protein